MRHNDRRMPTPLASQQRIQASKRPLTSYRLSSGGMLPVAASATSLETSVRIIFSSFLSSSSVAQPACMRRDLACSMQSREERMPATCGGVRRGCALRKSAGT